jgi:hypothetical protein
MGLVQFFNFKTKLWVLLSPMLSGFLVITVCNASGFVVGGNSLQIWRVAENFGQLTRGDPPALEMRGVG